MFFVTDVQGPAIIGLLACQMLGLVKLNIDATKQVQQQPGASTAKWRPVHHVLPPGTKMNTINDLKHWFPDCFDGIGCFEGPEQLYTKPNAEPFIDAHRRCPIHIRDKVKSEVQHMEDMGIIWPVTSHTDWCSSVTYAVKKDSSLHICLDPQRLNEAPRRFPHKIPTVEEISLAFTKARYISKLDAKAGYWSVQLGQSRRNWQPSVLLMGGTVSHGFLLVYVWARTFSRNTWIGSLSNVKASWESAMRSQCMERRRNSMISGWPASCK